MSSDDVVSESDSVVVVYVTAPTLEVAQTIANAVVEQRLAACVNLLTGMTSVYRWQGAIQHDSEVVLLCKTTRSLVAELESKIKALHPYDCPCIVAFPVVGGSAQFLEWVNVETRR